MNPEFSPISECMPQFDDAEKAALKEAGFGALSPYEFARFRHEDIENLHLSAKVFIKKRKKHCLITWYARLYKANDHEIISHAERIRPFRHVHAALDWLGVFAGQRTFPALSENPAPLCGQGCQEGQHQAVQQVPGESQEHGQESILPA